MKIQFIVAKNSGISYHRLVMPMEFTQWDEGDSAEMLWVGEDEHKIDCDILIYNKFIQTDYKLLEGLKKKGMKIIVDVDDFWELAPSHPLYTTWNQKGNTERVINNMKIADLVICTTMKLQERVREFNKNTIVIPNALPFGLENYIPNPRPRQKMGFIYVTGSTHLPDVELLRGKFKRIGSDSFLKENAEFILAGYNPTHTIQYHSKEDMINRTQNFSHVQISGPYDKMSTIFSYTGSHRVLPSTNQDEYINFYDQADVSIVPLVDSTWNSLKSELKIVEAAAKGLPVICFAVEPYSSLRPCEGIMWVDKPDQWIDYIRYCVKNPMWVKEQGMKLNEWVSREYNLLTWNITRMQVYKSLMR